MAVVVRGLRELNTAFARADKQVRAGKNRALREASEPVRSDAETLARERISRMTARWSRMRVGITRTVVYVAPRERGTRGRGNLSGRPRFGTLLMDKAMEPALGQNAHTLERNMEVVLDKVGSDFNRGGHV